MLDKQTSKYKYSFDFYGNLYIEDMETKRVYQVDINGRNTPCLEIGNYNIIENDKKVKRKTFKLFDKQMSLKNKLKEKLKEETFDFDVYDPEDDEEYSDYYPEDNDHINNESDSDSDSDEIIDEEEVQRYGENNKPYSFWGMNISKYIIAKMVISCRYMIHICMINIKI